mmetsp:Transcript_12846/g.36960  ORF Transcript_12846/g.36960 Transcript_12846/m.36960 type:complete len:165 (-) Transcript_12846:1400-1894(-)
MSSAHFSLQGVLELLQTSCLHNSRQRARLCYGAVGSPMNDLLLETDEDFSFTGLLTTCSGCILLLASAMDFPIFALMRLLMVPVVVTLMLLLKVLMVLEVMMALAMMSCMHAILLMLPLVVNLMAGAVMLILGSEALVVVVGVVPRGRRRGDRCCRCRRCRRPC